MKNSRTRAESSQQGAASASSSSSTPASSTGSPRSGNTSSAASTPLTDTHPPLPSSASAKGKQRSTSDTRQSSTSQSDTTTAASPSKRAAATEDGRSPTSAKQPRVNPTTAAAASSSPSRTSPGRGMPMNTSPTSSLNSGSTSAQQQPFTRSTLSSTNATSPKATSSSNTSPSTSKGSAANASSASPASSPSRKRARGQEEPKPASPPRTIAGGAAMAPTSPDERIAEQKQPSSATAAASTVDLPEATSEDLVRDTTSHPELLDEAAAGPTTAATDDSASASGEGSAANTSLESEPEEIDVVITQADGQFTLRVPQPLMLTSTIARGAYHQCGTARRVKVYELAGETWNDRGTGYCAGVYDEGHDEALLVARLEESCTKLEGASPDPRKPALVPAVDPDLPGGAYTADGKDAVEAEPPSHPYFLIVSPNLGMEEILLKTRVVKEDVYQKQQDTLVVWTEPDGVDMALSFQEADGCHEVWEFITEVQKHFHLNNSSLSDPPTPQPGSPTSDDLNASAFGMDASNSFSALSEAFALPEPSLGNLETIEALLRTGVGQGATVKEKIAEWIVRVHWLRKLVPIFHEAEDLESLDSLHLLCRIVQSVCGLNESSVIECILDDSCFLGVLGMFEYDPDFPQLKASYRDYIQNTAKFKQVVEIDDPKILVKIHQCYKLQYLRDVILARVLDDAMFSVLNSWVFFHQVDIVNYCTNHEDFLSFVTYPICSPDSQESREKKHDTVFFLQQLCAMGKQIQLPARIGLYRTLAEHGLITVIEYGLDESAIKVQNAAAEMLMVVLEYDPNSVRNHVLEQADPRSVRWHVMDEASEKQGQSLFSIICDLLHSSEDQGLVMTEALRVLFDVGSDSGPSNAPIAAAAAAARTKGDPDRFLTWFYETDVEHLFSPLKKLPKVTTIDPSTRLDLGSRQQSALVAHLCDLLCYIVAQHTFRSQYYVITSEISAHVGSLLFAREKHLRLAAIKFFRSCLASNNQFTNRHFLKQEIFKALLTLTTQESKRDTLTLSACLELFEHVNHTKIRAILDHIVKEHREEVENLADNRFAGKCFRQVLMGNMSISSGNDSSSGASKMTYLSGGSFANKSDDSAEAVVGGDSSSMNDSSGDQGQNDSSGSFEQEQERIRRERDLMARGLRGLDDLDGDEDSYFNDDDDEEQPQQSSWPSTTQEAAPRLPVDSAIDGRGSIGLPSIIGYSSDDEEDVDKDSSAESSLDSSKSPMKVTLSTKRRRDGQDASAAESKVGLEETSGKAKAAEDDEDDPFQRMAKRATTDESRARVSSTSLSSSFVGGGGFIPEEEEENVEPMAASQGQEDGVAVDGDSKPSEEDAPSTSADGDDGLITTSKSPPTSTTSASKKISLGLSSETAHQLSDSKTSAEEDKKS